MKKKSNLWYRTIISLVVILIGLYMVFGPSHGQFSASSFTWEGIKKNLSENINLGLDLKGGSHLVMRVKVEEYMKALTDNYRQAAFEAAKDAGLSVTDVTEVSEGNTYSFTLIFSDPSQKDAIIEAVKKKADLDNPTAPWTISSTDTTITWSLPIQSQKALAKQATEQALKIIESRINAFGVKEPTLQVIGSEESGRILLQMPGVEDPERVKKLISAESKLELMKVVSPPYPSPVQTYATKEEALASIGGRETLSRKVFPYTEREDGVSSNDKEKKPSRFVVVETPAVIDGSEIRDAAAVSRTGMPGDYQIVFSLKPTGAQKFGEWTERNINNYMAVRLNDEVKSIAYIKSKITDSGEITGRFTKESAEDLALTLKSGALPAPIEYQEERTVGPSLGADSIRAGISASIGGLIFVMSFMLFYYRGAGINAVIALLLNLLLTMAAVVFFDATLTLPGIAGLILGIGMAVDSNVLIFERIREELLAGKTIPEAIDLGFDRAFVTIIDTHVTTIIAAVILYIYGTGAIRGFAVTLILGLLINLFSAVYVSKTIFMWLLEKRPNMQRLSI
ncbi:MAG: protein translocase subunit SecD [Acidobacteria bacterium]|jgi:preprotein translocase subunit SecD|nr:MAG: protein translocase subunit SecD [Acidobacteriota bacterium]GIU82451.1 MAG: protein translocase subunit SecD [Pyrinomonadaceae bacterium]